MRVSVLHQACNEEATVDEQDVVYQRDSILTALRNLGHAADSRECTLDLQSLRHDLETDRPDVVFNLVESLGGSDRLITIVPALLEALEIPYTGVSALAIARTTDKLAAKRAMLKAGIPTAPWIEVHGGDFQMFGSATWPSTWIRKPIHEHASFGMNDEAVIECEGAVLVAEATNQWSRRLGRPCFAESFIAGREFNLSMIGVGDRGEVMPVAEIEFLNFAAGKPRIVGYDAKWTCEAAEYEGTPRTFEVPSGDRPLLEFLSKIARECWEAFDLRGYVRVDFRVNEQGEPFVLEINANPCLSPDGGFAAAVKEGGYGYEQAIAQILAQAIC